MIALRIEARSVQLLTGVSATDKIYIEIDHRIAKAALGDAGAVAFGTGAAFCLSVPRGSGWEFIRQLGIDVETVELTAITKTGPAIRQLGPLEKKVELMNNDESLRLT